MISTALLNARHRHAAAPLLSAGVVAELRAKFACTAAEIEVRFSSEM
jgi:hypothetical protein